MRILAIAPYPPERDGIGIYTERMTSEMRSRALDVRVISARPSKGGPREVIGSLSKSDLADRIEQFAPDIVHLQFGIAAYGTKLPRLIRLIARLRRGGVPIVVTMHEVTRDIDSLRTVGTFLYRQVARRTDHIIVHTEKARKRVIDETGFAPSGVVVIPHAQFELPEGGVPQQLRERFGLTDRPVILAFGFIDIDKGLDDLIQAVAHVRSELGRHRARVVIAGEVRRRYGVFRVFELRDHLYRLKLRRLVRRLNVGAELIFAGFVPDEEVGLWFRLARILVLPYRRSEQSGVASLAVAAGTPLLTTSVGGIASLGSWPPVPPHDPTALARGLLAALKSAPIESRRNSKDAQPARSVQSVSTAVDATIATYVAVRYSQDAGVTK